MAHRQPSDYRFESEIQQDILAEFGTGKPMRVWRNNVAVAYPIGQVAAFIESLWRVLNKRPFSFQKLRDAINDFKKVRPVRFSVVGSADILGILMGGRGLGIECKMPGEVLEDDQVKWRDMWLKYGGVHITATCIEDVYRGLEAEGILCR